MKYDGFMVGQIIRDLREAHNMSLEEFAFRLNKSTSHISQLENGSRRLSMNLLYAIMPLFQVDANTLLGIQSKNNNSIDEVIAKLPEKKRLFVKTLILQIIEGIAESEIL